MPRPDDGGSQMETFASVRSWKRPALFYSPRQIFQVNTRLRVPPKNDRYAANRSTRIGSLVDGMASGFGGANISVTGSENARFEFWGSDLVDYQITLDESAIRSNLSLGAGNDAVRVLDTLGSAQIELGDGNNRVDGLDLTGWDLRAARSVSDDGNIIVGQATKPNGLTVAYLVDLTAPNEIIDDGSEPPGPSAIPEPSTLIVWSLLGTVAITIGWRQRRKHAA